MSSRTFAAVVLVLITAGCGGDERAEPPRPPAIEAGTAERLAAMSEEIAEAVDAGDVCGAAHRADDLHDETVTAINSGAVPQRFQEDLLARVNELVDEVNCPPPPPTEEEDEDEEEPKEDENGNGNGKGKGKGKGNGNGDGDVVVPLPTVPTLTEVNP